MNSTLPTIVTLALLLHGCAEETPTKPAPNSQPDGGGAYEGALPLLPIGQHASMIIGFEELPIATAAIAEAHWQQALDAGMQVGRIQMDWKDVDLGEGRYDKGALSEQLDRMQADGLSSFVSLYAIDSEGLVVPDDLSDPTSPTGLIDGKEMDDPMIVARYREMLDWAAPMIVSKGGWVLSIANEPEGYLSDNPNGANPAVAFMKAAISHGNTVADDLAYTVTFTSDPIYAPKAYHHEVISFVDATTYNYYCLTMGEGLVYRGPSASTIVEDFDKFIEVSKGKEIIFQEFGCPAGYAESIIGTSEAKQDDFFRVGFAEIGNRPSIRAAFAFQMVDWSAELIELLAADLRAEGLPPVWVDTFYEWFRTTGFIRYEDGSARPSWNTFLEAI